MSEVPEPPIEPRPPATFRPAEHVRRPGDFRRAFARKRSASDELLIVYAVENPAGPTRLGISVGRKKVRRATDRNRVKRLLREAFRLHKDVLPRGVDLVVVPRHAAISFAQASRSLPALARAAARRLGPRPAREP